MEPPSAARANGLLVRRQRFGNRLHQSAARAGPRCRPGIHGNHYGWLGTRRRALHSRESWSCLRPSFGFQWIAFAFPGAQAAGERTNIIVPQFHEPFAHAFSAVVVVVIAVDDEDVIFLERLMIG